jgi:adenine-specific DNA-methyltransferase
MSKKTESIKQRLDGLNEHELRHQLVAILTEQKLGLVWERDAIARDEALNADVVLPEFVEEISCRGDGDPTDAYRNLIIEGDNFDSLRMLKSTHANKIRVIYIDPPYNTGNKDWVYNDNFVGQNDRWRHSQWLEFLFRRLELARDLLTPDGGLCRVSVDWPSKAAVSMKFQNARL